MAVWYCSSVKYAAVAAWQTVHVYAAAAIVRQTAPTAGNERCFRTVAGGTSGVGEPSWVITQGGSTTDGTVTWVEVTGQSTYGWNAPFQNATQFSSWATDADDQYLSSDHAGTRAVALTFQINSANTKQGRWISVNSAGSTPPIAADVLAGATVTTTGNSNISIEGAGYTYGMTFVAGSAASGTASIRFQVSGNFGSGIYDTCNFQLASTGVGSTLVVSAGGSANAPSSVEYRNCTVKFAATAQSIQVNECTFNWIGGSIDAAGSAPTTLFGATGNTGNRVYLEGVDLSKCGSGNLVAAIGNSDLYMFSNCRLGASYVALVAGGTKFGSGDVVLVNCHSGSTNNIDEKHNMLGDMTTEATIVRTGGSNDGTNTKSWKVVSTAKPTWFRPFECIKRAVWNDAVSGTLTLAVEIVNDGTTFKDSEVWVDVDYLGSSTITQSTRVSSRAATVLTAGANIATSGATWTTTGLGSPIKQQLSVAFAPRMKGFVYYTVSVGVASKTLYVDPKAAIG